MELLEDRRLLATVTWVGAAGGAWNVGSNWSGGNLPGASDDVVIDIAGANPITHSGGSDTIHSLTSQETLVLSGGTLKVTGTIQGGGGITLSGGTLDTATVQQLITATTSGGILSGVTLKGDAAQTEPTLLNISGNPVNVGILGDLKLDNATINVQGLGRIDFNSAAANLTGSG